MYREEFSAFDSPHADRRDSYKLARAHDIETERSWYFDPRLKQYIFGLLPTWGVQLDFSDPDSRYLDTKNFLILRKALATLRFREGGRSSCGETYHPLYGLKYLHYGFERAAIKALSRQVIIKLPADLPKTRREIERQGVYHREGTTPGSQLPKPIREKLAKRLDVKMRVVNALDLHGHFDCRALREKMRFQFRPHDFVKGDSKIIPFHEMKFSPMGSVRLRGTMCMEMAFDECHFEFPKVGKRDPVPASQISLGEHEIIAHMSDVSDEKLFLGDYFFHASLRAMDDKLAEQFADSGYRRMTLQSSKAAYGYGVNPASAGFAHLAP